jgi:ethanolamine utilization protein EutN
MVQVMIIGKVTGNIVSTRKNEKLQGQKLLVVEIFESIDKCKSKIIAIDNVGAGIGEVVVVAQGSAARIGCNLDNSPVDAAIVGIVDNGSELEL